ncbi:hypothetical protein AVEN_83792-1 [Araneus ventricosus]|uniref:Uncharacterized protein n=1 Tax=Araneus ventricosus TaxID=182803 RepID=A0A4Y2S110_ARAVE|nr:hypothetical protein AVEN_83792-1 [Araneus ventricosus]
MLRVQTALLHLRFTTAARYQPSKVKFPEVRRTFDPKHFKYILPSYHTTQLPFRNWLGLGGCGLTYVIQLRLSVAKVGLLVSSQLCKSICFTAGKHSLQEFAGFPENAARAITWLQRFCNLQVSSFPCASPFRMISYFIVCGARRLSLYDSAQITSSSGVIFRVDARSIDGCLCMESLGASVAYDVNKDISAIRTDFSTHWLQNKFPDLQLDCGFDRHFQV